MERVRRETPGGSTRRCRVRTDDLRRLGIERGALAHAEAVLLVDDDKREVAELDRLLDQRVRADHQLQLPVGQPAEQIASPRRARRAGQELDRQRPAEQPVERAVVLLGERLRGRHERGLCPVLDRAQHRRQRHRGLAGADLAHQEALHRPPARKVGVDLRDGPHLVTGQLERQRRAPAVDDGAARLERARPPALAARAPAPRHRQLHQEELLEREPPASVTLVLLAIGEVGGGEGSGPLAEPLSGAQAARQRLDRVVDGAVVVPHELAQPRRRDALARGVDGNEADGVDRGLASAEQLVLRHPQLAAPAQLPMQQHGGPLAQLAGDPGLVEPDGHERAALVEHARLDPLAAPVAHRLDGDAADRRGDRRLLSHAELAGEPHVAAVAVGVRQVLDQVADGLDAEPRERLARLARQLDRLGEPARARQ